jgi:hypothetical protein
VGSVVRIVRILCSGLPAAVWARYGRSPRVYDPTASLDTKPTKEDVINALRDQYGLAVKESKTKKIRQVEFYVGGSL